MKKVIITEEAFKNIMLMEAGETGLLSMLFQMLSNDDLITSMFSGELLLTLIKRFLPGYMQDNRTEDGQVDYSNFVNQFLDAVNTNGTGTGAMSANGVSQIGINLISRFETGHDFGYTIPRRELVGYDDGAGNKTYGYGLTYHPTARKKMYQVKPVWTQKELEGLFIETVGQIARTVKSWSRENNIQLGQNQFDAIVSILYNCGIGRLYQYPLFKRIAANPNDPNIPAIWQKTACTAGGRIMKGLQKRRAIEAALYSRDMKR